MPERLVKASADLVPVQSAVRTLEEAETPPVKGNIRCMVRFLARRSPPEE